MKTMHLFAGIGGGLLADLILGHEPIIAVEWDKYACKVLRERVEDGWFPNMQVYEGDVRVFNPSEYAGRVDCIHAGFPCQDISVAGKQAGVGEETRSGLYREVLRIADVVRPQYIFLENVAAILSNGMGTVLADLYERGYYAKWVCVRASDVGANHGRDRWWLLASNTESARTREYNGRIRKRIARVSVGEEAEPSQAKRTDVSSHSEHARIGRWEQFAEGVEKASNASDTKSEQRNGINDNFGIFMEGRNVPEFGDASWENDVPNSAQREGMQRSERSKQEYSNTSASVWWETECLVGRVDDGDADRVGKLKGLGNAQVPLQAAVAFSMLMELMT